MSDLYVENEAKKKMRRLSSPDKKRHITAAHDVNSALNV